MDTSERFIPVAEPVLTGNELASAIKYGLQRCQGDVAVVMDTDFSHDPQMIPQMIELLKYSDHPRADSGQPQRLFRHAA